mmetsp:Transcript_107704/g.303403  ORF Transcript_107704/g.303403 Transcript_107704/m.303403 type:complete len:227 (+) Transcript_107704:1123-1803(+)
MARAPQRARSPAAAMPGAAAAIPRQAATSGPRKQRLPRCIPQQRRSWPRLCPPIRGCPPKRHRPSRGRPRAQRNKGRRPLPGAQGNLSCNTTPPSRQRRPRRRWRSGQGRCSLGSPSAHRPTTRRRQRRYPRRRRLHPNCLPRAGAALACPAAPRTEVSLRVALWRLWHHQRRRSVRDHRRHHYWRPWHQRCGHWARRLPRSRLWTRQRRRLQSNRHKGRASIPSR